MPKNNKKDQLCVVGIGASAGGLEPLQQLISHLPKEIPGTAIIIAQHLSPDYKSMLVELLARKTTIPVKHVKNRVTLEGNTIYIAPPNADVVVTDGLFFLEKPLNGGAHPSVDVLFTSLAKAYASRSCGIILSGTGKDGSNGVRVIKQAGGVTVVQNPESAKYDGMPQAAVGTELIDYILTPEQIGNEFNRITTEIGGKKMPQENDFSQNQVFMQIFDLLERRIGIDFREYKTSTLSRRLQKRLTEKHFESEKEYLDYIRQKPEELDHLFEEILIGVTSFFRDPLAFKAVAKILEKVIREKKSGETLRVWIPGCATGEEAYTYVMLIQEILEKSKKILSVQIFATDIDIRALHKARLGIFSASAVSTVPKEYLSKYFTKVNEEAYELHKNIRKKVLFSRHDVTSNPPFLRLDIISCRNLLIYFNTELQKRVFPLFYYALHPDGYLILGKSENIGPFDGIFKGIDAHFKIFQRKSSDGTVTKLPQFKPLTHKKGLLPETTKEKDDLTVSEMVKETLYGSFEYPYVVIDDRMDIVEVHGDISKYLKFKEGTASLHLMKLIVPSLQIEARVVIGKAMKDMKPVYGTIRKIVLQENPHYIKLTVKPLLYAKANNPYFIVIFQEVHLDESVTTIAPQSGDEFDTTRMIELEQELDATKEHMNSLIEELETSNEELQALNEEMQASNEELQASNEELETSNEELQATNEELENAYTELREANNQILTQKGELEQSAQNLDTLLTNTMVGYILIDKDYRVITSNKTARSMYQKLFSAKLQDGASFIKVIPDSIFPSFHQHFRKALDGEQVITESAIRMKKRKTVYLEFNYTPVKRSKHEAETRMVAVSFTDNTRRKEAELDLTLANEKLAIEKQFMDTLAESLPSMVWTTDNHGKYLYCNKKFLAHTGLTFEELQYVTWKPFIHPTDWKKTNQLWKKSLKTGENLVVEHRIKDKDGNYCWFLTLATRIKNPEGLSYLWVGTSTDIHEQKMLDERKNEFISIASHELKTPVTSLKGYAQVLNIFKKRNDMEKLGDTIIKIDTQLNRLTDLINDLLDVSRIESGKLQFTKRDFSFDELVDEVIDSVQFISQKHNIKKIGQVDSIVHSDRERLEQVMINLISNAIKYSPDAKNVLVTSELNHKNIIFSVKDAGIGIPKEKHDKVFARFFRVNEKASQTISGMGLGLYISAEIIKRLGGKIWFESEPKKGSTFYFTVPLKN